ncbi:MAG: ice-binding family protein [Burkholderiaceae bacterium]
MNLFNRSVPQIKWAIPCLLAVSLLGCGGDGGSSGPVATATPTSSGAGTGLGGAGHGPSPVVLGAAGNFVILAQSAITDVPTSPVTGNVGLSPATGAGIGLSCAEVTGTIYTVDAAGPLCRVIDTVLLTAAVGAKDAAYTDAAGRAPDYTELAAGNIGGLNLGPATYKWSTGVSATSDVTLTGGPNDVWIFQIAQGLSVSSGVHIILAGGALPKNIFWQTFAAADLGTTSQFSGIILSQTSIAMKTGASINGRLYASTAVTLDQNTVTQPAP